MSIKTTESFRAADSSPIQYPRFQTVANPDAPIYDQKLVAIGRHDTWFAPDSLSRVLGPLHTLPTTMNDEIRKTNWWGVYHHVRERSTAPQTFFSPVTLSDEVMRTTLRRHSSLWDHQAWEGTAYEVVLQRQAGGTEEFTDVAALLAFRANSAEQELVIADTHGWRAPAAQEEDMVGSYLYTMDFLSLADLNAAVDNRGS